jgi:hypothetical protein
MNAGMDVDTSGFDAAIARAKMSADDLYSIARAGSVVVETAQKLNVAVDTGATRASIDDRPVT